MKVRLNSAAGGDLLAPADDGEGYRTIARFTRFSDASDVCRQVNANAALLAACRAFLARYDNWIVRAELLFSDVASQARAATALAEPAEATTKPPQECDHPWHDCFPCPGCGVGGQEED